MVLAILLAISTSEVERLMLKATSGKRAPTATMPAVGVNAHGCRSPGTILGPAASPACPQTGPCGWRPDWSCGARRPMPHRERPAALASCQMLRPTSFDRATQSSCVISLIGMNGITSTAPMRGCSPWCFVRSMRSTAFFGQAGPRLPLQPQETPKNGDDAAVVAGVAAAVQHSHAGNAADLVGNTASTRAQCPGPR